MKSRLDEIVGVFSGIMCIVLSIILLCVIGVGIASALGYNIEYDVAYKYKRFDLGDGHSVMCVIADGHGISCDWDRMK